MSGRFGGMSKADNVIRKYVRDKMPERVKDLIAAAKYDVNFGPHGSDQYDREGFEWPGYFPACREIEDWWDSEGISDLWVDEDSDNVLESEPEGYQDECDICDPADPTENCHVCAGEGTYWREPELDSVRHYPSREVKRIVLGDLIGNGID